MIERCLLSKKYIYSKYMFIWLVVYKSVVVNESASQFWNRKIASCIKACFDKLSSSCNTSYKAEQLLKKRVIWNPLFLFLLLVLGIHSKYFRRLVLCEIPLSLLIVMFGLLCPKPRQLNFSIPNRARLYHPPIWDNQITKTSGQTTKNWETFCPDLTMLVPIITYYENNFIYILHRNRARISWMK